MEGGIPTKLADDILPLYSMGGASIGGRPEICRRHLAAKEYFFRCRQTRPVRRLRYSPINRTESVTTFPMRQGLLSLIGRSSVLNKLCRFDAKTV